MIKRVADLHVGIQLQRPKEDKMARETIDDLHVMLKERLQHWERTNRKLPDQIIVYRDGVSDDFYNLVKKDEFSKMRQTFQLVSEGHHPQLVYFVVLKWHSTRFFPSPHNNVTNPDLHDRNSNIKPGLLVQDTLTPTEEDLGFFLQSHGGLKGESQSICHNVTELNF